MGFWDDIIGRPSHTKDGIVYALHERFHNQMDAEAWKQSYEQKGIKSFVEPNAKSRTFDLFIEVGKDPRYQQPQKQ